MIFKKYNAIKSYAKRKRKGETECLFIRRKN